MWPYIDGLVQDCSISNNGDSAVIVDSAKPLLKLKYGHGQAINPMFFINEIHYLSMT